MTTFGLLLLLGLAGVATAGSLVGPLRAPPPSLPPEFQGLDAGVLSRNHPPRHARIRSRSCDLSTHRASAVPQYTSFLCALQLPHGNNRSTRASAAGRTGVAVPEDIRGFGRLRIYHWLKPTVSQQQLQQQQQERQQQQEQQHQQAQEQQLGGLLGPLSYFYDFDVHLQRVGAEVYYEAAASAVVAQAEAAAEAAREAATTASARPVQQPPPFCMQLQGASEGSATPDGCSEQREQQQADIEEPRGGGVLLEVWLPGVSPRDIAVQLSLVGRHREAEIIPGVRERQARPPCGSVASTPSVDELASNYVLNEDFLWEETVEAAEERIANRRKPPYLPPPLPCLIINAPKSTRALKWETETFKTRFRDGRSLDYQRYQRALRLAWPADWSRAEARFDSGRLLVVIPPLPIDAPPPNLLQQQDLFPLAIPVQELPTPLPPFPGFTVTNTRADWLFNFARFPQLYDVSADFEAAKKTLKLPHTSQAAANPIKPKVRVPNKKNWKEA
ncbi:uncharacterized protein LOC34623214 [Cyclospora cayetanensis]|uniref:Uncharacterized protein LOC34623214 n=1 Tax=Cyclospora cayetanensis TaxID=88456 RepID=A0A6P6S2U5_9EIME|nr:uncharacterized protein LOC34623214 [Cyclospora cayetanensis]